MSEVAMSVPMPCLQILIRTLTRLKGMGNAIASEGLEEWDKERGDRVREIPAAVDRTTALTDSDRLDFLERIRSGYGDGVVCRLSTTGRGFRLHETSLKDLLGVGIEEKVSPTVREAIDAAMQVMPR